MIELKNICKKYKDIEVLKNFDLVIENGEMIALCGLSGAGKSTILNIIGTLEKPTAGSFYYDKKEIKAYTKSAEIFRKEKLGYVFQNFALVDEESIFENLNLVLHKGSKNERKKIMSNVLKKLGIDKKLNSKIYSLSGGEQQRVALARVILKNPEIILADEPTGSLDKKNGELVLEILKEFKKQNKTIIVVTHDTTILEHFDRVIQI